MCGIIAIAGSREARAAVARALPTLKHRGPDSHGEWSDEQAGLALGHTRLRIIDLSDAGTQPMASADGRFVISFNGEVYNHLELREELADYPFRSRTDTEVVLAAWSRWGPACLERFLGMFAFVLWDARDRALVAVRDRFGVKPLFRADLPGGGIGFASEIKALRAAGVASTANAVTWATFLSTGLIDHSPRTFWTGVEAVPAGHLVTWRRDEPATTQRWYDLAARAGAEYDDRDEATVRAEYLDLLADSVRLRFRSDVSVGINLSGGVDSSALLGLVHEVRGPDSDIKVFSFGTGHAAYDELPWVEAMLARTQHPLIPCMLAAEDVPDLAARITLAEDEPFGGLPTLAYATVFERARQEGVTVLLDGVGMDEQWAGYDYYRAVDGATRIVQGSIDPAVRPACLSPEVLAIAEPFDPPTPFADRLRNLQVRDALYTKLPRGLRFNDRISMAASTELREPFLDHRLFELALRQPPERKIRNDTGKWLLREITAHLIPDQVRHAPKRPLQTPQREWLRGPLRGWADELIETAFRTRADWFDVPAARDAWRAYQDGRGDNSFWVWQWLSIGLASSS